MKCSMNCFECVLKDCTRSETADVNEQKALWIKNNPEKRKAIRRRYYEKHREAELASRKIYRANNLDEIRRKDREAKALKRERRAG